jgi:RNA-directed DNA polymerase
VATQPLADVEASGVDRLREALAPERREKRSHSLPVRRVDIPQPGKPGQRRGVGLPAVRDRMVQTAVQRVIAPIVAADCCDGS